VLNSGCLHAALPGVNGSQAQFRVVKTTIAKILESIVCVEGMVGYLAPEMMDTWKVWYLRLEFANKRQVKDGCVIEQIGGEFDEGGIPAIKFKVI
jgi:hypothetical protein